MTPYFPASPCWSTSSFGPKADTAAMDLAALGEHLDLCQGQRGRLFALHCVAEAAHSALAARFVTTLVAIALLFIAVALAA
jgi:hypothetical protein